MTSTVLNQNLKRLVHSLVLWMPLWIGTTFVFGFLGIVYVLLVKQDLWLASQALLVRDEASGTNVRLGRFDSETQMKAAQETILEVARHNQVVATALKKTGPEVRWFSWWGATNWPSKSTVDATAQSLISMHAPKGAEFGATEVIYLDVKQPTPDRALKFCKALCNALEIRLQQVRKSKADSIVMELTHARDSAREQLRSVTEQLQQFERIAGIELSDLRGMTDMIAGGGNSRIQLDQLKSELRVAEASHQELLDDLKLLEDAIANPSSLIVTPTTIVSTQPGLKRLREGYAEAQLSASQLSGKFTEEHPLLVAARTTQESIHDRLVNELEASQASLNQEISSSQHKIDRLRSTKSDTESKLGNLADKRADYANVISEVKTRTAILEAAERELAEAQAVVESAATISLISWMDAPTVSDSPVGIGKTFILGFSTFAGLLFGLGGVFLLSSNEYGTRFGRRITDLGRRREDRILDPAKNQHRTHPSIVPPEVTAEPLHHEASVEAVFKSHDLCENHTELTSEIVDEIPSLMNEFEADDSDRAIDESIGFNPELPMIEAIRVPALDEHPKDASFRDFLVAELNKSDDRRQHPRSAQSAPVSFSLGMRPTNPDA
ncbi:MAG: hypothetical protein SGI77_10735 [Pirellulaceae bacterium]|nr:hypothetical protein [Pirellulaceae bacterium]